MRTRIIATLGPACDSEDTLLAMLTAGMSFARLNFSHGHPDEHRRRAQFVRRGAQMLHRQLDVIQDLQGPKIRTVEVPKTVLAIGDLVTLGAPGQSNILPISKPEVLDSVEP